METNVISSADGKVDTLSVKEGQQVKAGQLLLTVNK
jgi:multidrug efflux pump subunit AcrA (membrane-fusion protein)